MADREKQLEAQEAAAKSDPNAGMPAMQVRRCSKGSFHFFPFFIVFVHDTVHGTPDLLPLHRADAHAACRCGLRGAKENVTRRQFYNDEATASGPSAIVRERRREKYQEQSSRCESRGESAKLEVTTTVCILLKYVCNTMHRGFWHVIM